MSWLFGKGPLIMRGYVPDGTVLIPTLLKLTEFVKVETPVT